MTRQGDLDLTPKKVRLFQRRFLRQCATRAGADRCSRLCATLAPPRGFAELTRPCILQAEDAHELHDYALPKYEEALIQRSPPPTDDPKDPKEYYKNGLYGWLERISKQNERYKKGYKKEIAVKSIAEQVEKIKDAGAGTPTLQMSYMSHLYKKAGQLLFEQVTDTYQPAKQIFVETIKNTREHLELAVEPLELAVESDSNIEKIKDVIKEKGGIALDKQELIKRIKAGKYAVKRHAKDEKKKKIKKFGDPWWGLDDPEFRV